VEWAQREYKWSKQRESEAEDDVHDRVASITQPLEWAWGDEGPSVPWRPVTRFEVLVDRVEWVCGKTGKTFKWFFPSGDSLACIEADEKALGARGCGRPLHGTLETSCGDAARTDSKCLSTYTKRGGSRTWWTWKDEDTSAWFELKEKHSKVALFKAPSEEEAQSIVGQVQMSHKKRIELEKQAQCSAPVPEISSSSSKPQRKQSSPKGSAASKSASASGEELFDLESELSKFIGLEPIKQQLRDLSEDVSNDKLRAEAGLIGPDDKKPAPHMLFIGNPGG